MKENMESIRILHVDDNPDFLEVTATFLERANERLSVDTATSANEGLDCLAGTDIDCIISDYEMPGRDGIEFLEAVRADYPDVPFILFTGKGSEEIASKAISAGVSDYLQKGSGTDQYTLLANRAINAVEKHAAEKEVQTTRNRFETLLEHSADYIHILDADGTAKYHSPSVKRVLGYDPEELDGTNPFDKVHPDDRERATEQFETCIEEPGREVTTELRAEHKDGSWRMFEVKSRNLLDDPTIGGVVGNVRDITDRKETEARVDWHKEVIRNMQEGVYVLDADYAFQFVNYRAEGLENVSEQNWTGRNVSYLAEIEILTASEVTRIQDGIDRIIAGDTEQVSIEIEPALPEATELVEIRLISFTVEADKDLILGTTRDITEYKQHEQELREEQAFSEAALEGLADFYWGINLDGTITRWSDTDGEVTGYTADEAIGMHSSELHPDEHVHRVQHAIDEMKDHGSTSVEAELVTKDGEQTPYYFTGTAITDDNGEIRSMCGLGQDISEQRKRERHLERSETIVNSLSDAAFVVEDDWTLGYANESALDNVQASAEDVKNRPMMELVREYAADDEGPEQFERALERAFDSDIQSEPSDRVEMTLDVDGKNPTFEYQFSPIVRDGTVESVAVTSRNITDRKERESELKRQNERLDEFASVVSHDLRNPLRVAESYLELADEGRESEHLDSAIEAINRSQKLIDDLLTLAREGEEVGEVGPVSLAAATDECCQNVEMENATISIETEAVIQADRSRLKQLLANLIRNAIEHGEGDVRVTVGEIEGGIYVADNGPGIPEAEQNRVFEAGYSLKDGGTGFGLSIVNRIVQAHGWDISIGESDAGGALFKIEGVELDSC